jgi:hypothetical protein
LGILVVVVVVCVGVLIDVMLMLETRLKIGSSGSSSCFACSMLYCADVLHPHVPTIPFILPQPIPQNILYDTCQASPVTPYIQKLFAKILTDHTVAHALHLSTKRS